MICYTYVLYICENKIDLSIETGTAYPRVSNFPNYWAQQIWTQLLLKKMGATFNAMKERGSNYRGWYLFEKLRFTTVVHIIFHVA